MASQNILHHAVFSQEELESTISIDMTKPDSVTRYVKILVDPNRPTGSKLVPKFFKSMNFS